MLIFWDESSSQLFFHTNWLWITTSGRNIVVAIFQVGSPFTRLKTFSSFLMQTENLPTAFPACRKTSSSFPRFRDHFFQRTMDLMKVWNSVELVKTKYISLYKQISSKVTFLISSSKQSLLNNRRKFPVTIKCKVLTY